MPGSARFIHGDVTQLDRLPIGAPCSLILDLGCFHGLNEDRRADYAAGVSRFAAPGALYLLYGFEPRMLGMRRVGFTQDDIKRIFGDSFKVEKIEHGTGPGGAPTAWYCSEDRARLVGYKRKGNRRMQLGVFLPISGRATGPDTLREAAQSAERGFDAVGRGPRRHAMGDSHALSLRREPRYVPPDRPFLDSFTCLAYLAGCTPDDYALQRAGAALPPSALLGACRRLHRAAGAGTADAGSGRRPTEEEFAALGVPFKARGRMTDEQLRSRPALDAGAHQLPRPALCLRRRGVYPKPMQQPRIPLWVGGEGAAAQRRAGRYGDAWFPYFVSISPAELRDGYDNARREAEYGATPTR